MRRDPIVPDKEIPKNIILNGIGVKELKSRDYQYETLQKIFKEQRGIVKLPTGSGKTFIAYALIKYLYSANIAYDEKILFIAPNISIMTQVYDNIKAYLPNIKVGLWGNGKKQTKAKVICATIQTISNGLKKPKVKLTSQKDMRMRRMATTYYELIMGNGAEKKSLKLFLNNFVPQKKYEIKDKEALYSVLTDSDGDNDVKRFFNNSKKGYKSLLIKKAGNKYKKYEESVKFMDYVSIVIVDECLVGNTLISMNDGMPKHIKDIKKGDVLRDNNKVLNTIVHKNQPIWTINYEHGFIKGTLSHPIATVGANNNIVYKLMYQVKPGDFLLMNYSKNESILRVNDKLINIDGTVYIKSKVTSSFATDINKDVYDLTTENGTFYANGVLNHNCHHSAANSYQESFKYLPNARMRVGLTGTIDSGKKVDNLKIKSLFGNLLSDMKDDDMIKQGYIAKPHIVLVDEYKPDDLEQRVELELARRNVAKSQVPLTRYNLAYDFGIVNNEHRNKLIASLCNKILNNDSKKAILIIVKSIDHGEIIKNCLDELGIKSAYLQGKDSDEERKNTLNEIKNESTRVLIGTKIMDEGIDIPNFRYFINASSGKSYKQLIQRIGRTVRLEKDKKDVFIFDIVDRTHSMLFKQLEQRLSYYKQEKFDIVKK